MVTLVRTALQHLGKGFTVEGLASCCTTWGEKTTHTM